MEFKTENNLYKTLLIKAAEVAKRSYSPYSKFRVGAALYTKDEETICGTNIENRSFGLTNCAERSAFFTALSEKKRGFTHFSISGV